MDADFMKDKIDIALVTNIRLHHSKGGIEKVMIDFANEFTRRGHRVSIVFFDKNGSEPGFPLDSRVKLFNCSGVDYPIGLNGVIRNIRAISLTKESYRRKRIMLASRAKAFQMADVIKNIPADVFVTYDPRVTWMLYEVLNVRKPIVSTIHFSPKEVAKRSEFSAVKMAMENAGPIQVLLPGFVEEMKKFIPGADIVSIPNVVAQVEERFEHKAKKIINVGRVTKQKNQMLLAEAWEGVANRFPEWSVEVWGEYHFDEKYASIIKTYIKDKSLARTFRFCGTTSDVKSKLAEAAIYAFPSIDEGFSLALTEAMACGLPSIGLKNCPSVNELIVDGVNGILCDETPEDLARSIEELIVDVEKRNSYGRNAIELVKKYSPDAIWSRWESFVRTLL